MDEKDAVYIHKMHSLKYINKKVCVLSNFCMLLNGVLSVLVLRADRQLLMNPLLRAADVYPGPFALLSLSCPLSRSSALMSVWSATKVPLHVGYNTPLAPSAHARQKTPLFFFARNL